MLRIAGLLLFVTGLAAQDIAKHHPNYGTVPIYFEENKGQTDTHVRYVARSANLVGFVLQDGWTLSIKGQPISMHVVGADSKAPLVPELPVEGITNYYLGSRAITNIQHYSSVRGTNIRPDIDIVYHGNERELEYDLVIRPGTDVGALRLRFEGSRPVLADNGDVVLKASAGEIRQHKPRVWQEANGKRTEVECRYSLLESADVGFVLSNYDHSAQLTIDPIISYSTYLGGTTSDTIAGIAVDSSGHAFVTGSTVSPDFPVTNGTTYRGGQDIFVTKLNPSGTGLVYSTFIGGTTQDTATAIALDNAGNAYVTGSVYADQFPPVAHAFVLKLGATGNIVYSTALAGNNFDSGLAIATDASGSAYVTGSTGSTTFPVTAGAYKTTAPGGGDAFVTKLSANGQISYSTYLGGSANDAGLAIAVDAAGNAYVGGFTSSSNFATTPGAYATASAGGDDGFVVKLNPAGSALVYSTYLGGASADNVLGLAVDAAGNCYVTGSTLSSGFPTTPGAFSTSKGSPVSASSAFVTKLNATGTALIYSTFLGGNVYDTGVGIAVDSTGFAYVVGSTQSTNFPVTPGALKTGPVSATDYDMFLTKVAVDGASLSYSTLLGSSDIESAVGLALDQSGGVYIAGSSRGLLYPTTIGAYQFTNPKASSQFGTQTNVITKIDLSSPTLCSPSISPPSQSLPGHGGSISFNLTLAPGCPWEAMISGSVTLDAPTHGVISSSPTIVTGTVPINPSGSPVTQTVRIGAATFTVNQGAGSCQDPLISPQSVTISSASEVHLISLMLPSSCVWTAVPGAPWLTVSNPNGVGPATLSIGPAGNVFSQRTTTLTIAGKSITVTQLGSTCTGTASITTSSTSAQGGDGIVAITPNSSACYWTAYPLVPWIKLKPGIDSSATGQGAGFIPFIFAANPTAASRTGQILIADITVSFTQDAGPAGPISYTDSIVAGGGSPSTPNRGDGGPALGAFINCCNTLGLAFDSRTGNLYIVDPTSRVRVVTPDGNINTFAGGGSGTGENIPATSALLSNTAFVAVDSSSAVYINDSNSRVRKISQGDIVTIAGASTAGFSGDNGPAISAQLNSPSGIAVDSTGNVYISDTGNNRVRKISTGMITTFAGGGNTGLGDNGPATSASLSSPYGVALDASSNLLIVDAGNARIRRVAQGNITTVAGGGSGGDGGPATSALLVNPFNVAVDSVGQIFIASTGSQGRIRKVSLDGTISTINTQNFGNGLSGGLAVDGFGNLYYSSLSTGLVNKLTAQTFFCTYSVSLPPQIPAAGGASPISVTTAAGCPWSALALPTWLSPVNGNTRIGSDTLTFIVSPNSGPARTATIAVAGRSIDVMQAGAPSLSIVKTHSGNFAPGQTNATYFITVSNAAGFGATSGTITVTDMLPPGLTLVSISGSGWICQTSTCTRSDVLNGGAAYAPIAVKVNVAANATSPQVNQVNVSGGGSPAASASDSTIIAIPALSVSHSSLNFATLNGIITGPQTVTVNFIGSGGVAWTATSNQPNIIVTQGSGTGNGSFQVSAINGPSGIVTVTAPTAIGSPKQIQVNISTPSLSNPFGSFDTPADNTSGIAGALPVTGWALDAVEVVKLDIWREPVGGEPAGPLIFIGDAVFVEGARPDVETLNPNVPFNYRAGWGYQMLTNFLPNGNGTFKLHAIAHNKAGNSTDLGTKTIIVDNAHASKPFGTIDTPTQGGTASGNAFLNFAWALTQNPNKIPIDGSTILVVVDGQFLGHPTYNQFRSDIASLFPGYMNSNGAVGFFYIDTTKLTNGVHTISWSVYDNAGHGDGIGSRYFNVFNSGNGSIAEPEETRNRTVTVGNRLPPWAALSADKLRLSRYPSPRERFPGVVEMEELGRVELPIDAIDGYQLVNCEHRPLPIGSSLKSGVFYWQPGPGFLGEYHLVFEHTDGTESHVRVNIRAKTYPRQAR
jgi:uncharacterized repeat protein (TIGR01451 family)